MSDESKKFKFNFDDANRLYVSAMAGGRQRKEYIDFATYMADNFLGLYEISKAMNQQAQSQQAKIDELKAMLKQLEWEDVMNCQVCGGYMLIGHTRDCQLSALIKE